MFRWLRDDVGNVRDLQKGIGLLRTEQPEMWWWITGYVIGGSRVSHHPQTIILSSVIPSMGSGGAAEFPPP